MPNNYLPRLLQIRPQYTPNPDTAHVPQNILWFLNGSAGTPTLGNLTSIGIAFDSWWGPLFAAYGGTSSHYTGSVTTDWSGPTGLAYDSVGAFTPVAGTAGESLTASVAILISWAVPFRWRGGHFRTYLPYAGQGTLTTADPNQITAAIASSLVSKINALISGMEATNILGGQTLSMYKQHQKGITPETFPVSSYQVNTLLASQRRRLRKVTRK